jgi:hypothetical protein
VVLPDHQVVQVLQVHLAQVALQEIQELQVQVEHRVLVEQVVHQEVLVQVEFKEL